MQKEFLFSKNGEQIVKFIGRFESLERDFKAVCRQIGVVAELPKLNVSRQTPSYREYYDEILVELVRERYQPDIDLFDYQF